MISIYHYFFPQGLKKMKVTNMNFFSGKVVYKFKLLKQKNKQLASYISPVCCIQRYLAFCVCRIDDGRIWTVDTNILKFLLVCTVTKINE